jgi:hypothetical protein
MKRSERLSQRISQYTWLVVVLTVACILAFVAV